MLAGRLVFAFSALWLGAVAPARAESDGLEPTEVLEIDVGGGVPRLERFDAAPPRDGSGILFDDAIREALRAESAEGREAANIISDIGTYTLIAYPFIVDTAAITWLGRGDGRLALRMFLVDAGTELAAFGTNILTKYLVRRERPLGIECDRDPGYDEYCGTREQTLSFYSSHTSFSFTSAGIVCSHAFQLNMYGSEAANISACSIAMGTAATVGILRIVADKHWSTDVIVGAVVGTAMGMAIPALIGYGARSDLAGDGAGSGSSGGMPLLEPAGGFTMPVVRFGGAF